MTDIDTAAIEARLASATPGPWVRIGQYVAAPTIGCNCAAPPEYGHEPYCGAEPIAQAGDNDADLIAHAPTDLRALLDEVDRLRATIAAVEALAEEWSTATCQTDGAPCSWHRVSAECAAELLAALDGER